MPVNCQQNAFSVIPAGTEALFTRDVDGLGKTVTKPMFVSTVNNDFFNSQIGIATGNGTLFSDNGNLQKYSVNVKSGSADIIFGSDTVNLVAGDIINDFPTLGSLIVTSATTDFKMLWAVEVLS